MELTNRKNSLPFGPNAPDALRKTIESVRTQTQEAQYRIDMLKDQLLNMNSDSKERTDKLQREHKNIQGLIGWDEEKKYLQDEKAKLKTKLNNLKEKSPSSDTQIQTLQKRYLALKALDRKWGKTDLSTFEADADSSPDIDSLLQKAQPKSTPSKAIDRKGQQTPTGTPLNKQQNGSNDTIKDKKPAVDKLETKVSAMRNELDRKLTMFRTDEKTRVTSIEDQRRNMFDAEEKLINKIQETQLKIAIKKQ